jgi:tetratricopeptide (TPR) repeat protein
VQQLALTTLKSDGPAAAEKQIAAWQKKRPDVREIGKASMLYVQTVLEQHQKDGEHAMALAAAERCRSLLDDTGHQRLVRIVCDNWARTHSQKKEWTQTLAVYSQGLKSRPKDSHLTRNAAATWNTWAGTHIDSKDWAEAIKVYDQALKQFPNDGTFKNNLKYCQQQAEKQQAEKQ